jgi:hypothetical protein
MMKWNDLKEEQKHVDPVAVQLLCNWPDCRVVDGGKAPAERLCPCCRCVGYCCIECMQRDWERHQAKECQRVCPNCNTKCRK